MTFLWGSPSALTPWEWSNLNVSFAYRFFNPTLTRTTQKEQSYLGNNNGNSSEHSAYHFLLKSFLVFRIVQSPAWAVQQLRSLFKGQKKKKNVLLFFLFWTSQWRPLITSVAGLCFEHFSLERLNTDILHWLEICWLGGRRYRGVRVRSVGQLLAIGSAAAGDLMAVYQVLQTGVALQDRLVYDARNILQRSYVGHWGLAIWSWAWEGGKEGKLWAQPD